MKFQLLLQKIFFRLVMVAAFAAFIGVFVYALQLEKREEGNSYTRLPETIEFGKANVTVDGQQTAGPLSIQHMGEREVAMRFSEIIAESLSFNGSNFRSVTSSVQKNFTEEGYAQYLQFLSSTGLEARVAEQNLQAGAYLEEEPVELGHGSYSGVYKWVFEVPVTVSLIPRTTQTYDKGVTSPPQNRDFVLRAQFARVNDPQDPNAIKIELWQVFPARVRK